MRRKAQLAQGAAELSMAQSPQMDTPWRNQHGARRISVRLLRSGAGGTAPGATMQTKPYIFKFNSEKGVHNLMARKILFRGDSRSAQARFQVWKHIPILLVMNSITLFYVIDLIMSS
ncbi:hypothetical protein QL285_034735 [Trifolium repens]|nr:hypothetical protein QL285_034735 [Trifolium repens]